MTQARPALTVDVNMGGPGGRNIASKSAAQARASAQAPSSMQQQSSGQATVRPGDIISEEDLMAQGGFSSDEEGQDEYSQNASNQRGQKNARAAHQNGAQVQGPNGEVSLIPFLYQWSLLTHLNFVLPVH
jgi:hypothetical protein